MNDPTDTASLGDAENNWRVEAVSSLHVPLPPSRRALAASLRSDVPLPQGSPLRELIQKWAAGEEANEEVDTLVTALVTALIWYSNALADHQWRAGQQATTPRADAQNEVTITLSDRGFHTLLDALHARQI